MSLTIVQHAALANTVNVTHNTTGTVNISLAFPSPVTVGNMLVVFCSVACDSGNNTGPGVGATNTQTISDSLFNSYVQADWVQGGVQIKGLGAFVCFNSLGGSDTVTFQIKIPNANPIFNLDQHLGITLIELTGFTSTPAVQGVGLQQNNASGGAMNIAITDAHSTVVTSGFGSPNQQSGLAIDIAIPGDDLFFAGYSGDLGGSPTVSPGPYMTYALLDGAAVSGITYIQVYDGIHSVAVPSITCDSPPAGTVGTGYSHAFPASGGTPPYSFSIISGSLPTGLSLDSTTGIASGVPTTPGTFPFTVQVSDANSITANVACSITIGSALSIICNSPPAGTVGTAYSHAFPASGGTAPYSFSIISGTLPGGLTLNSSTGVVSGTPTTPGTFPFRIQVVDASALSANVDCSITITSGLSIICNSPPPGSVGVAYSHAFPASGGTAPYTFSLFVGPLPGGLTLNTSTGVVSGTPTTPGTFPFTIRVTDALAATANVDCSITIFSTLGIVCNSPPAGVVGIAYTHAFPAAGGTAPYTFAITVGALPGGLTLDASTGVASGTPNAVGTFPFTVQVTDSVAATANVACSITVTDNLAILCNDPPPGLVGAFYFHTLTVTGGLAPFTFSIVAGSLPPGLALDATTGVISGTPTAGGTFPFTVQVMDASSTTVLCAISILSVPALAAGCPIAVANVQSPYTGTFPAAGGTPPYFFAVISGNLPDGLSFDPATGLITGTPNFMASYSFTWRLTDSTGAFVDTGCTIVVGCPVGSANAKFQLWSHSFKTQPADRAEVVHSTDWDDLGHPYDKKLQSITFEYSGEAGDITMQMETLLGINGITNGVPLLFPLIGNSRSKQQFGIPDGNVVKMIRISPTTIPSVNWRDWKYFVEKTDYPADFVLFTEKRIFDYECEKIARTLRLDIDTGGVNAAIDVVADGAVKQTIIVNTTSNDRSRIIALNSNEIGREWNLEIRPGPSGKSQLFTWNLDVIREPCSVDFYDSYEQDLGAGGIFKWIKQAWVEYQSDGPLMVKVFVDGGNLFFTQTLPAHPVARDVERWYFPAIDPTNQFLNKSKKFRFQVIATTGKFKLYADSIMEFTTIGDGQRLRQFNLTERNQLPVA